jgi:hypothetical protein
VLLRHAKNVIMLHAMARLSERVWSMAHHLYAFQKMERKWLVLENFNNFKTEETPGVPDCFYGFYHHKAS